MKKVLICFLILMTFSNICYAQEFENELKTLEEYEIFIGDENGYRLSEYITKGEFIKMLAVSMMYVDITKQDSISIDYQGNVIDNSNVYNDLDINDWEYPYFMFLDFMGINTSYDNRTSCKDKMTYLECYNYLIRILGYEVNDIEITIKSTQLGITKGITVVANGYCTRNNAVKLIFNTLNIPLCAISSYDVVNNTKEYVILDGKQGRELRTLKTNLDRIKQ